MKFTLTLKETPRGLTPDFAPLLAFARENVRGIRDVIVRDEGEEFTPKVFTTLARALRWLDCVKSGTGIRALWTDNDTLIIELCD